MPPATRKTNNEPTIERQRTMTTSEKAARIRKELKNTLGYNNRMVAVKSTCGSITIRCKEAGLDAKAIYAIASQFKNVHYDEMTGEVLAGGNTFVFVVDENGYIIPTCELIA